METLQWPQVGYVSASSHGFMMFYNKKYLRCLKLYCNALYLFPKSHCGTQGAWHAEDLLTGFCILDGRGVPGLFGWPESKSYNQNTKWAQYLQSFWRQVPMLMSYGPGGQLIWSPVFEALFFHHRHKSQSGFVVSHAARLLKNLGFLTHLRWTLCFANGFPNRSLSGNMNLSISSYLCPTGKQNLVTYTFGPRFTLLRYWRPFPVPVSDVIGSWRDKCATVMHDWHWLAIYFSGSIDVCQVFGISILCLVMFGVVFSCGCIFVQQVFVLINVSASYHLICHLRIHQRNPLSCEMFHPAARFAWGTFLATIVGGASFIWRISASDAEDTGLWKDVSVDRMFVAIFFGIKNWALYFFSKILTYQYAIHVWTMVILVVLDHVACFQVQHVTTEI